MYTFGFDMGENSLGWAVLHLNGKQVDKIEDCGSFVWDPSSYMTLTSSGAPDHSLKHDRSLNRLARRHTKGKRRRTNAIKYLLCQNGLINILSHNNLGTYDIDLCNFLDTPQLRVDALDKPITDMQLAHLLIYYSNHRGAAKAYLNNATSDKDDKDKEQTKMKKYLEDNLKSYKTQSVSNNFRTYGEYQLSIYKTKGKIHNKDGEYTHSIYRELVRDEAKTVLISQQRFNKKITDKFIADYLDLLYSQTSFEDGVGFNIENMFAYCALEPDQKRAPKTNFYAEISNALDTLENVNINGKYLDYDTICSTMNELLRCGESLNVKDLFGTKHSLKIDMPFYNVMRQCLKFDPISFPITDKSQKTIDEINSISFVLSRYKTPANRVKYLDYPQEVLDRLYQIDGNGTNSYSVKAYKKLIPLMQSDFGTKRMNISIARDILYPVSEDVIDERPKFINKDVLDACMTNVNNPVVKTAIHNTSWMYNQLVTKYGIPYNVCFEMARELARTVKEKKDANKINNENKQLNDESDQYCKSHNVTANFNNRMRYKLWKEQNHKCMYTGQEISEDEIFNCEIDHIIPRAIGGMDKITNRVLVTTKANREKGKKTIIEYLNSPGDHLTFEQFKTTVESNDSICAYKKKRLLLDYDASQLLQANLKDNITDLQHTQFGNKVMIKILANVQHTGKIVPLKGAMTAEMRSKWIYEYTSNDFPFDTDNLFVNLKKDGEKGKDRTDLRHHAMDAIIIGCFSFSLVQKFYDYYKHQDEGTDARLKDTLPYPYFTAELVLHLADHILTDEEKEFLKNKLNYNDESIAKMKPFLVYRKELGKRHGAIHKDTIYKQVGDCYLVNMTVENFLFSTKGKSKVLNEEKKLFDANHHIIGYPQSSPALIEQAIYATYSRLKASKVNEIPADFKIYTSPDGLDNGKGNLIKHIKLLHPIKINMISVRKGIAVSNTLSYWRWYIGKCGKKQKGFFLPVYVGNTAKTDAEFDVQAQQLADKLNITDIHFVKELYKNSLIWKEGHPYYLHSCNIINSQVYQCYDAIHKEPVNISIGSIA